MITPIQCRMARAAIGWGVRELAANANIGISTVTRFESGVMKPNMANLSAIRSTFEAVGVIFIAENGEGPGVRLKKGNLRMVPRFAIGQIWESSDHAMVVIELDEQDPHVGFLLDREGNSNRLNVASLHSLGVWSVAIPDRFHLLDNRGHVIESAPGRNAFDALSVFGNSLSRKTNSRVRLTFIDREPPSFILAYLKSTEDSQRGLWPVYLEGGGVPSFK